MRILFVSAHSDPFKDISTGSAQRTHFLLKACAAYAETDVCAFVKDVVSDIPECNVVFSSDIQDSGICFSPVSDRIKLMLGKTDPGLLYRSNPSRTVVIDNLLASARYDFIVVRYFEVAASCGLFKHSRRLVIDIDDHPVISHMMRISAKGGFSGLFPTLRTLPDRRVFKSIQEKSHFTFFSNPDESKYINSSYLPNLPFLRSSSASIGQDDRIFFVGSLNYMPNRDGITWFIDHIWPSLKAMRPSLTLHIAGSCDDERLISRWMSFPGVNYLGFVEDIRKEYSDCKIVIAPIYQGTGTNIKVLEAMAMGKVCVTTPVGARGFENVLLPGRDLFVASSDDEFKSLIMGLLDDDRTRKETGGHAIDAVRTNFTEEAFNRLFSKCLK